MSGVTVFFDAREEPDFKGPGAHHPDIPKERPKGTEEFPSAFSFPGRPYDFMPFIIDAYNCENFNLNIFNKIVCYYDQKVS